jgi:hypothetical protein
MILSSFSSPPFHTSTVLCTSPGELLVIKKEVFVNRLKLQKESWDAFVEEII